MTLIPARELAEIVALTSADAPAPTPGPGRTITGWIVRWDVAGNTSAGPTVFVAGSIALPADLSRVKLLLDHDASRPVGYMIDAEQRAEGIVGTFHVPAGELGDLALTQAANKLRDGMSVGAQIVDYSFDAAERLVVKASELNETSLVSIPAFRDAIVSDVTASRKDRIVSRDKLLSIAASGAGAVEQPAPAGAEQQTSTEQQPAEQQTSTEQQPAETSTTVVVNTSPASPATLDVEAANRTRVAAAAAPVPASPRRELTLPALSRLIVDVAQRDGAAGAISAAITAAVRPDVEAAARATVEAALSDVTPNNISTTDYGPKMPRYVRDLFVAADVARPLWEALGPAEELTSLKVWGHVWETRPVVGRYAGNKAPIPSAPISRKRIETTAQRWAGGWDVDRVFVDLPSSSPDEIEDILTEGTKSYLTDSEAWLGEQLSAQGTQLYGDAVSVPAALAILGSYFGKIRGSRISVIELGTDAWEAFANMTEAQAPWWLKQQGELNLGTSEGSAGGLRFVANPDRQPTEIVAADKRAVRLWEARPPIKVRAIDVANGGIDVGVFGYGAGLVTDPRLVVSLDTAGRVDPTP